nr:hypothetical protein [Pectobacterium brasiliense]
MNRAVLPSGWKSVKIGSIARVTNGANISSKYKSESNGNTPVYKVLDITEAILNENGNLITASHLIDNGKIAELKSEMLSIGTTVFPKVGESVNLNRRAYVLKEGFADNNVMAIRLIIGKVHDLFTTLCGRWICGICLDQLQYLLYEKRILRIWRSHTHHSTNKNSSPTC